MGGKAVPPSQRASTSSSTNTSNRPVRRAHHSLPQRRWTDGVFFLGAGVQMGSQPKACQGPASIRPPSQPRHPLSHIKFHDLSVDDQGFGGGDDVVAARGRPPSLQTLSTAQTGVTDTSHTSGGHPKTKIGRVLTNDETGKRK